MRFRSPSPLCGPPHTGFPADKENKPNTGSNIDKSHLTLKQRCMTGIPQCNLALQHRHNLCPVPPNRRKVHHYSSVSIAERNHPVCLPVHFHHSDPDHGLTAKFRTPSTEQMHTNKRDTTWQCTNQSLTRQQHIHRNSTHPLLLFVNGNTFSETVGFEPGQAHRRIIN